MNMGRTAGSDPSNHPSARSVLLPYFAVMYTSICNNPFVCEEPIINRKKTSIVSRRGVYHITVILWIVKKHRELQSAINQSAQSLDKAVF